MILNNKRKCLENHYIYKMGCLNSKPYPKKRLQHSNSKLNSKSNLLEEDNFIFPKKKKRQRKRKRDKKKQKQVDKEKQQSILDALLGRNKKEKTPLLKPPSNNPDSPKKKRKAKIPLAMRQNVWFRHFGRVFEHKCFVSWCPRIITCFDFEVGHNIPECKGGKTDESNLFPICHKCNGGMGSKYTIEEWSNKKFFTEI